MKDKNDILKKHIRERLKDFEQPVPDHIWSAIEEDLVPTVSISRTKKLWRAVSIAASFLLIMSLGTVFFAIWMDGDKTKQPLAENKIETIETPVTKTPVTTSTQQPLLAENNMQDNAVTEKKNNTRTEKVFVEKYSTPQSTATVVQTTSGTSSAANENKPEEKSQQNQPDQKTSSFYTDALANDDLLNNIPLKQKKKTGISYALAVGNASNASNFEKKNSGTGIMPSSEQNHLYSSPAVPIDFESQSTVYTQKSDVNTPADYKHDLPISVGFAVRKHFSDKFALESGLVYTHLASEGKIASATPIINNISLNYLGIPVKGVYSLYNNKRFSVYASAGGMVEKSISGTFKSTIKDVVESKDLNVKELQWSLTGSAGINVQLAGHLGLFVEPGVAYYFKDGSGVVTIRKDRPFNLNLQAGLRLSY
jgi:hypothetical protein